MGNDLLLYESRKRAIERVKRMQEENKRTFEKEEGFNVKSEKPFENNPPFEREEFKENNNFSKNQNFRNSGNNKRGFSDILGNIMGGNTLNMLKGQLGEVTGPLKGIMDYFDLDSEKLIIIMVMYMLFNEKEDKTLLLALGYLLL